MRSCCRLACFLSILVIIAGCASTKVTDREIYIMDKNLPRPDHIFVHDLAATPADVPAGFAMAGQYASEYRAQTSDEIATGRELGERVATKLIERIRDMGLPAEKASAQTRMQVNDILFWGYFISVDKGSADMRMAIGFRQGVSELQTAIEGYQMTARGLRKLGSGTIESSSGKTPGMVLPVAVAIATENPAGLIVGGALKVGQEVTGRSTIEGRADATAKEIAEVLKKRFKDVGWIK